MGSGPRLQFGFIPGVCFGVTVERFPHNWSINVLFLCVTLYIGIGKGYDE